VTEEKNPAAVALGKLGDSKGGRARKEASLSLWRIVMPKIDAMKGKEPAICGSCLVETAKLIAKQAGKDEG